jgi:hypothetical protein
MTTPHDATQFSNPAQSSPAETSAQNAAEVLAAEGSYHRSFESTVSQYRSRAGVVDAPDPVITETIPPSANANEAGGTINITIIGTGFTEESKANWNANDIDTVFTDETELVITVPRPEVAEDFSLYVDNGHGNLSNTITFQFENATQ